MSRSLFFIVVVSSFFCSSYLLNPNDCSYQSFGTVYLGTRKMYIVTGKISVDTLAEKAILLVEDALSPNTPTDSIPLIYSKNCDDFIPLKNHRQKRVYCLTKQRINGKIGWSFENGRSCGVFHLTIKGTKLTITDSQIFNRNRRTIFTIKQFKESIALFEKHRFKMNWHELDEFCVRAVPISLRKDRFFQYITDLPFKSQDTSCASILPKPEGYDEWHSKGLDEINDKKEN